MCVYIALLTMAVKSGDHRTLTRMDSDTTMRMVNNESLFCGVCLVIVDRSKSGYLSLPTGKKVVPTYQRMDKTSPSNHHRRVVSMGEISYKEAIGTEPQLVRSGGLRRDWSFENLYECGKDLKRKCSDKPNSTTTTTK